MFTVEVNAMNEFSYVVHARRIRALLGETVLPSSTMLDETTERNFNSSNLTRIRKYILDLIPFLGVSDSVNEENGWSNAVEDGGGGGASRAGIKIIQTPSVEEKRKSRRRLSYAHRELALSNYRGKLGRN